MKINLILFLILFSILIHGKCISQGRGTLEIGEFYDNLTHSFKGDRNNFSTNTIYFAFTLYEGIQGTINSNYCNIEVDAIKPDGRELNLYTSNFDIDPEWYSTWTTIQLPQGNYRLKLYDDRGRLLGKSMAFKVR